MRDLHVVGVVEVEGRGDLTAGLPGPVDLAVGVALDGVRDPSRAVLPVAPLLDLLGEQRHHTVI